MKSSFPTPLSFDSFRLLAPLALSLALAGCACGPADVDGDGYNEDEDCDDTQALIYPGAPETCNGLDDDCDGLVDDGFDADLDGYTSDAECADGDDCDDDDPAVNPGAEEACNGEDDNCDGGIDEDLALVEWCVDNDGDGVGGDDSIEVCDEEAPAGYVECADPRDCDDEDGTSFPGAEEQCDNVDHDCDGDATNGLDAFEYWADDDGDGYGAGAVLVDCTDTPPTGFVAYDEENEDCDDTDEDVNPDGTETCNTVDDDCNGVVDDTVDADGDGFFDCDDCDDANADVNPGATEVCNGIDDDCDTLIDPANDGDGDGYTICGADGIPGNEDDDCDDADANTNPFAVEICDGNDNNCDGVLPSNEQDGDGDTYPECLECDDTNPAINPGATEICDGLDTDCDTALGADEVDVDGDQYLACTGYVANGAIGVLGGDDCNDADDTINPAATETCDGTDEDCDGTADEDFDDDEDGVSTCGPDGIAGNEDDDCNDFNDAINPSAIELCDNIDNDCDSLVDVADTADFAGNDYDADGDNGLGCGGGDCDDNDDTVEGLDLDYDEYSTCQGDCDDTNGYVAPGQSESCNGVDTNCDGEVDDADDDFDNDHDGDGVVTSGCGQGGTDCNDDDHHVFPDVVYTSGVNAVCDPAVRPGFFSDPDYARASQPAYFFDADTSTHYIYYRGHHDNETFSVLAASSADGVDWTKLGTPLLQGLEDADWDDRGISNPSVVKLDDTVYSRPYVMAYHGQASSGGLRQIGIATAPTPAGPFDRLDPLAGAAIADPVLPPSSDSSFLDGDRVLHPTLWYDDSIDRLHIWYSGRQASPNTIRVFHAFSDDGGMTWTRTDDDATPGPDAIFEPTEAWHGSRITMITAIESAETAGEFDFLFTGGDNGVGAANGPPSDWSQDITSEVLVNSSDCNRMDGETVQARGVRHDTADDVYHWYYASTTDIEATYDVGDGSITPGSENCTGNGDGLFFRNNGGYALSYVSEGFNCAPQLSGVIATPSSGSVALSGTVNDSAPDTVVIGITDLTNDAFLGNATVDAPGAPNAGECQDTTWSATVSLAAGTYDLEIAALDEAGIVRTETVNVTVP